MLLNVQDYDFTLPDELIARFPTPNRQDSKLLNFTGNLAQSTSDHQFSDIVDLLPENAVLVRNNTRVIPARCFGRKTTGAKVEVLLERITGEQEFLAHVRSNRSPKAGSILILGEDKIGESILTANQLQILSDLVTAYYNSNQDPQLLKAIQEKIGNHTIIIMCTGRQNTLFQFKLLNIAALLTILSNIGHIPLPPYMEREDQDSDSERYQTVYAKIPGAVAAPTAGLHFTDQILAKLQAKGIDIVELTLHVGAGTFMPIKVDTIQQHQMHAEWVEVTPEVVNFLNQAVKDERKIIAVGTTSVRSLETVVQYSIQEYLKKNFSNNYEIQQKYQALVTRDNLDKLDPQALFTVVIQTKELIAEKKILLNSQHRAALNSLADFLSTKQAFMNLPYTKEISRNFFLNSWQLLNELAKLEQENPNIFTNDCKEVFIQFHNLLQDESSNSAVFTRHYINTKLKLGIDIPLLPYTGNTEIFIHPGHKVHLVDHIITNFHLPKSTLIMLVASFIGMKYCLDGYNYAITNNYRFYSYGDSCFIPNLERNSEVEYLL